MREQPHGRRLAVRAGDRDDRDRRARAPSGSSPASACGHALAASATSRSTERRAPTASRRRRPRGRPPRPIPRRRHGNATTTSSGSGRAGCGPRAGRRSRAPARFAQLRRRAARPRVGAARSRAGPASAAARCARRCGEPLLGELDPRPDASSVSLTAGRGKYRFGPSSTRSSTSSARGASHARSIAAGERRVGDHATAAGTVRPRGTDAHGERARSSRPDHAQHAAGDDGDRGGERRGDQPGLEVPEPRAAGDDEEVDPEQPPPQGSGTASCRIVSRKTAETTSAAPANARKSSASHRFGAHQTERGDPEPPHGDRADHGGALVVDRAGPTRR